VNVECNSGLVPSIKVRLLGAFLFGAILAVSQALRFHNANVSFEFSIWTAIAFLVGFDCLFAYLRMVSAAEGRTRRGFGFGGLLVLAVIISAALLRPWWPDWVEQSLHDFAAAGVALCFVAASLCVVSGIMRAANCEEERQEANEKLPAAVGSQPQEPPKGKEMAYENRGS
jgi:hypothetical protein